MNRVLAIYLFVVGLIGGCAIRSPVPLPSPLIAQSSSSTSSSPVLLATPTVWRSPTPAPSPTQTASPRSSSTFTPTRVPTPWPQPAGRGACEDKRFRSVSLNQEMPFYLYLPPGYNTQSARRYPALYLLSGLGGNYKEWYNFNLCGIMDDFIAAGKVKPMIVVMPSGNDNPAGGIGSFWINHAPPPISDGKRWGDYVWKDLVTYIDTNYRTIQRRESRGVGGLSAGGQAALMHGLMHPELFSVVGAHSPSFRRADGSVAYFGDEKFYNPYDPVWLVQNTDTWKQLTIWIDDGDRDDQWGTAIIEYHNLLNKIGVPHEFHLFYGFHDPPYWATHTPDYLLWYASKLVGQ